MGKRAWNSEYCKYHKCITFHQNIVHLYIIQSCNFDLNLFKNNVLYPRFFASFPSVTFFVFFDLRAVYMPAPWHHNSSSNADTRQKGKSEGWYFEFSGTSWSETRWTSDQIYNNDDVILFNLPVLFHDTCVTGLHRLIWFEGENLSN